MSNDADARHCFCCEHDLMEEVKASVRQGKPSPESLKYLSEPVWEISNGFKLGEPDPNYIARFVLQAAFVVQVFAGKLLVTDKTNITQGLLQLKLYC